MIPGTLILCSTRAPAGRFPGTLILTATRALVGRILR